MKNSARIWKRTRSVIGMFLMIEASQFNFIGRCRKLGSRGRMRAKKGETKSTHLLIGVTFNTTFQELPPSCVRYTSLAGRRIAAQCQRHFLVIGTEQPSML